MKGVNNRTQIYWPRLKWREGMLTKSTVFRIIVVIKVIAICWHFFAAFIRMVPEKQKEGCFFFIFIFYYSRYFRIYSCLHPSWTWPFSIFTPPHLHLHCPLAACHLEAASLLSVCMHLSVCSKRPFFWMHWLHVLIQQFLRNIVHQVWQLLWDQTCFCFRPTLQSHSCWANFLTFVS